MNTAPISECVYFIDGPLNGRRIARTALLHNGEVTLRPIMTFTKLLTIDGKQAEESHVYRREVVSIGLDSAIGAGYVYLYVDDARPGDVAELSPLGTWL